MNRERPAGGEEPQGHPSTNNGAVTSWGLVPRHADHDARRAQVLGALVRCARRSGLHDAGYRDVAVEAGVSVRLVQYYFPSKHELLVAGLDHVRSRITARIDRRLADLPVPSDTREQLIVVFEELLPVDEVGMDLLLVHHAFGSLAFTDSTLAATPFTAANEDLHRNLVATLTDLGVPAADRDAAALIALVTGLGVGIAFGQYSPDLARTVLHHHLDQLLGAPRDARSWS